MSVKQLSILPVIATFLSLGEIAIADGADLVSAATLTGIIPR